MTKLIPITEYYQHVLAKMKESYLGDPPSWHGSERWERSRNGSDRFPAREFYQRRGSWPQPYRNGYYARDFRDMAGHDPLRIARARGKSVLPRALQPLQRRAEDSALRSLPVWHLDPATSSGDS